MYEDTYVKTPDGWRFKTRAFYASEGGPDPKQLQERSVEGAGGPSRGARRYPRRRRCRRPRGCATSRPRTTSRSSSWSTAIPTRSTRPRTTDSSTPTTSRPTASSSGRRRRGATTWPSWRSISRTAPNFVRHYLTNLVIEPTADGAIGKQYLVVLDIGAAGTPSTHLPRRPLRGRLLEDRRRLEVQAPRVHPVARSREEVAAGLQTRPHGDRPWPSTRPRFWSPAAAWSGCSWPRCWHGTASRRSSSSGIPAAPSIRAPR